MNNSDHALVLHPTRIAMPPEIRLDVITLLNQTLACTVDLRSQVKQACWNVKGKDFAQLHALFATMATALEGYSDLVAERIAVLGGVVMGTARTAALQSQLPEIKKDMSRFCSVSCGSRSNPGFPADLASARACMRPTC